jgi:hypothetical protein
MRPPKTHAQEIVEPDFSGLDSAEDIIRDAAKWGLLGRLRELLHVTADEADNGRAQLARDIAFEFASNPNRDLAVDLFVHVTGIGEYGPSSLRAYAAKHGCSHEWFRRQAEKMRRRLGLPTRATSIDNGDMPDAA